MTEQIDQEQTSQSGASDDLRDAPLLNPATDSEPMIVRQKSGQLSEFHSEFAAFHEGYVRHYIALADTKAGVLFALYSGIIAYLLSDTQTRTTLLAPCMSIEYVVPLLTVLTIGAAGAFSFLVIAPRLKSSPGEGYVIFEAVAARSSGNEYSADIGAASFQDLTNSRLQHCYDVSRICTKKYHLLRKAMWMAPVGLVLTFFTFLLA